MKNLSALLLAGCTVLGGCAGSGADEPLDRVLGTTWRSLNRSSSPPSSPTAR